MNPFNLTGPEFLGFYFFGALAVWLWHFAVRLLRRVGGHPPSASELESLDPYEAGYLVGGETRATESALAHLVHEGLIEVNESGELLRTDAGQNQVEIKGEGVYRGFPALREQHPFEREVLDLLTQTLPTSAPAVIAAKKRYSEHLRENLAAKSLINTPSQQGVLWLLSKGPLWALVLLGLVRIFIGMANDRPVLILVTLVGALIYFAAHLASPSHHTRRGLAAVDALKNANAALEVTANSKGARQPSRAGHAHCSSRHQALPWQRGRRGSCATLASCPRRRASWCALCK